MVNAKPTDFRDKLTSIFLSSSEVGFPICCVSLNKWASAGDEARYLLLIIELERNELMGRHAIASCSGLTIIFSTIALPRCEWSASCGIYNAPCLPVQITELAALGLDLGGIELGVMGEYVLPPLLLVQLLEMNQDDLLVLCNHTVRHIMYALSR